MYLKKGIPPKTRGHFFQFINVFLPTDSSPIVSLQQFKWPPKCWYTSHLNRRSSQVTPQSQQLSYPSLKLHTLSVRCTATRSGAFTWATSGKDSSAGRQDTQMSPDATAQIGKWVILDVGDAEWSGPVNWPEGVLLHKEVSARVFQHRQGACKLWPLHLEDNIWKKMAL